MPRRKIERSFEEEKQFQQQRRKRKADNQYQRNEARRTLIYSKSTVSYIHSTIHGNHVINLNGEISEGSSMNVTSVSHKYAEYPSSIIDHVIENNHV